MHLGPVNPASNITTATGISHLHIIFNEACRLDSSLHIETDVHLHLSLLVCQLDDWHLRGEKVTDISKHFSQVVSCGALSLWAEARGENKHLSQLTAF